MNRRHFLFSSFFLSTPLLTLSKTDTILKPKEIYGFENVHANIWVLHGLLATKTAKTLGLINNPAFIETKQGVIVIDPGGSYVLGQYVLKEIQKITRKPILALFNTHGHNDHFFANAVFQEAYPHVAIYAHENLEKSANELYGGSYHLQGFNFDAAKKVVFPTHMLKGGETLHIDGELLKIQHPKIAHTNNDITLSHLNSNSIFMGDLLMSKILANFGLHSSIRGNIAFLKKVKTYAYYIPGHGPSGKYKTVFLPYLTYLSIIEKEVLRVFKQDNAFFPFDEVEATIEAQINWEESLHFPSGFVNRYMYHIYSELDV